MDNIPENLEHGDFFLETLDNLDNTCLHLSLSLPTTKLDLVKFLLEKGLDVNAKNVLGNSPLQIAVSNPGCNVEVVKALLDRGADIDQRDIYGNSAIHHILRRCDCALIKLMIEKGANVNAVNKDGDTPLHYVVNNSRSRNFGLFPTFEEYDGTEANLMARKLEILKLLLKRNPDIDFENNFGDSPLHFAVSHCVQTQGDLTRLLLHHGANPNLLNAVSESTLHCAIDSGNANSEVIKLLLDHGVDINAKSSYGYYPLCLAVKNPAVPQDAIKLLLDRGANVLACNDSGDYALQKAIQDYDQDETTVNRVKLLIKYTLATSLGFNLSNLLKNTKHSKSLAKFATDCTLELIAMGSEKVGHIKYPEYQHPVIVTLYEFMCGYQALPPLTPYYDSQGRMWRNEKKITNSSIKDVLGILKRKKFPLYNEVISAKVQRKDMIDKLAKQVMFTVRSNELVILDFYSACGVARYLSNDDLLNWIMAYHGILKPRTLVLNTLLQKNLLGKRAGQEIERCLKRYKKTKCDIGEPSNLVKKSKILVE